MRTKKIISLLGFLFVWVGLVGVKFDAISIIFSILAPVLTFYLADRLSLSESELKARAQDIPVARYIEWAKTLAH